MGPLQKFSIGSQNREGTSLTRIAWDACSLRFPLFGGQTEKVHTCRGPLCLAVKQRCTINRVDLTYWEDLFIIFLIQHFWIEHMKTGSHQKHIKDLAECRNSSNIPILESKIRKRCIILELSFLNYFRERILGVYNSSKRPEFTTGPEVKSQMGLECILKERFLVFCGGLEMQLFWDPSDL